MIYDYQVVEGSQLQTLKSAVIYWGNQGYVCVGAPIHVVDGRWVQAMERVGKE